MKPIPSPDPSNPFEETTALAEAGRFVDAVMRALDLAGAAPEETLAAAAAQALSRIARLAEDAGDLASADRALEHALRLRPGYADLQFHHGALLVRRGRRSEARRALEAAIRTHPGYLAARVELAMLDAREGRIGEALAALREIQREANIDEPHAFQQGLLSLERADWEGADTLIRRAVHAADPRIEQLLDRYRALMSEGAVERASEVLREALDDYETYPDLHLLLGTAELSLGAYDDAVSSIARALELNPDYHAARVQLAVAFDALGDRRAATEQLGLILQNEPDHAPARELLERWTPRERLAAGDRFSGEMPRRKGP